MPVGIGVGNAVPQRLVHTDGPQRVVGIGDLVFAFSRPVGASNSGLDISPDGLWLAHTHYLSSTNVRIITRRFEPATGQISDEVANFTPSLGAVRGATFSRDGLHVFSDAASSAVRTMAFDSATGQLSNEFAGSDADSDGKATTTFRWSRDKGLMAHIGVGTWFQPWNASTGFGGYLGPTGAPGGSRFHVAWTPDDAGLIMNHPTTSPYLFYYSYDSVTPAVTYVGGITGSANSGGSASSGLMEFGPYYGGSALLVRHSTADIQAWRWDGTNVLTRVLNLTGLTLGSTPRVGICPLQGGVTGATSFIVPTDNTTGLALYQFDGTTTSTPTLLQSITTPESMAAGTILAGRCGLVWHPSGRWVIITTTNASQTLASTYVAPVYLAA